MTCQRQKKLHYLHCSVLTLTAECVCSTVWFTLSCYLYKLHHGDRVKEVEAAKLVQSVGGAGNIGDGQGGRVAGKDGVSETMKQKTISGS